MKNHITSSVKNPKLAVITGASSGIGKAFAYKLASLGYDLIITGRREKELNQVASSIRKTTGKNVTIHKADFACEEDLHQFAEKLKKIPAVDILVNNAGFGHCGYYANAKEETIHQMLAVHIQTVAVLTHAVLKNMVKRKQGTIINVSSESAFFFFAKNTLYASTKAFQNSFSESLYIELYDTGIKVQSLCPGFTKTDFHKRSIIDDRRDKTTEFITWLSAEKVVEESLKALKKNQVVCFPAGFKTKIMLNLLKLLPRKLYYAIMIYISRKVA